MTSDISTSVGHIPAGLFIVTITQGDIKEGYLASWVQQASFDPLIVSLAIKEDRVCYKHIAEKKTFAINVVGEKNNDYLKYFWKGRTDSPFDSIDHEISKEGGLLIKKAVSAMVCQIHSKIHPGDHEIFFAKVLASYVMNERMKPRVHLRKTGLEY